MPDETIWTPPAASQIILPDAIPLVARAQPTIYQALTNWSGTTRMNFQAMFTGHRLQAWYWLGWNNGGVEAAIPNTATLTASLEYPAGQGFRFTFNGGVSSVLAGGGWLVSDPLDDDIVINDKFFVWSYILPTANGSFGTAYQVDPTNGDQSNMVNSAAGVDTTGTLAAMANAAAPLWGPALITAVPYLVSGIRVPRAVVAIVGDSEIKGHGDYPVDLGWARRALGGQSPYVVGAGLASQGNYPVYKPAMASDKLQFNTANAGRTRHRPVALCNNWIDDLGGNDTGRTLAQLQADRIAVWTYAQGRGMKTIFVATITPGPSSTDGFATTGNQTPGGTEAIRLAYNSWLRDGAPMSNGAAAATGTVGAARCPVYDVNGRQIAAGSGAHPANPGGVIEVAYAVESAPNSGIYDCSDVRVVNNASTVAGGSVLNSATAAFVNAAFPAGDVGKMVTIAGAGTAGARWFGWISGVNSGTQAALSQLAPPHGAGGNTTATAVAGAQCAIGIPTSDGIHMSPQKHAKVALAVPTAQLVAA